MSLQEFINLLGDNPVLILSYFLLIPLTAFIAGYMGKDEGHLTPWKYLYSTLIYLICVPGIFAIALTVYSFLFERRSIMNMDVFTQILPVISMVATLLIIRKNVSLEHIPGFGKVSGMLMMIFATFALMWFMDRMRIIAFTIIPFHYLLIIFAAMLLIIRFGWKRIFVGEMQKHAE